MFRICRVFVAFVFCAFCVGGVNAAGTNNGPVVQRGRTNQTSNGNSVNSSTGVYTSGANSGGGQSSATCGQGVKPGGRCDVRKDGRIVGKGTCNNSNVCVAKECNPPYYLEHYTVVSDGYAGFKCSQSWQKIIHGTSEYGDDVQLCDSKGFCRTREQAKIANKCSVDAALVMVNGKMVIAGCQDVERNTKICGRRQKLEKNKCVDCRACVNVDNGTCEQLDSQDNQCKYKTSCDSGYEYKSGTQNTNAPVCNPMKYKITLDANGGNGCKNLVHTYGNETTITCVPTKNSFVFDGWCTTNDLNDPEKNRLIGATDMGDKTFYAKWTKSGCDSLPNVVEFDAACNPIKCVDKYILQNGECVACAKCAPGANAKCELIGSDGVNSCNYRTGCEPGYVPDQNENLYNPTCKAGDTNAIKNQASSEQEATEDEVYAINYNLGGGTGCDNAPRNYIVGEQFMVDCEPRRSNYVFDGWCVDTVCNNPQRTFMFDDANGGKKTLVAKWKSATKPRTECNDSEKAQFPNADRFEFVNGVCRPVHCARGYLLENGACVDDGIRAAEEEYASARENEMSLKNRLMSGAAIGATGIGGMQLASGIAEQSADADAAADMAAYTQKMQCRVSDRRYRFNEKSVNVGGENSLTGLYSEYVALADDLHERKDALGYAPGIESAVVFKREYTGLYDDVGSGVQNGTYASLYRASIGNENDISRIAGDTTDTQNRIDTGLGAVGIGAAGGAVGNILGNYVDFNKSESE